MKNINKTPKIYLVSSSTGGHAIPILVLANELIMKKYYIFILHSGSKLEVDLFKNLPGKAIFTGKLFRLKIITNIWQLLKIFVGLLQTFIFLSFHRPDIIFSKGGFVSYPVLKIARLLRIPYMIHESDLVMGLANRLFATGAAKVFVSFPLNNYNYIRHNRVVYSGIIVQDIKSVDRINANQILITGGSQGAKSIDQIIFQAIPELCRKFQIFHNMNESDLEEAQKYKSNLDADLQNNYSPFGFSIQKHREIMASSALIISRAGANIIGEIAILGKASILIPYPYAAADHQMKNAREMEKAGAAIIIKQGNLSANNLIDRINFIFSNPKNLEVMSRNAKGAIKTDGNNIVINELSKYLDKL